MNKSEFTIAQMDCAAKENLVRLKPDDAGSPHVEALRAAIAAQDGQGLNEAATRATSHLIRSTLAAAEAKLDRPGGAL